MHQLALAPDYLLEVARQIGFIAAFLGGIATTFLVGLLAIGERRPLVTWAVSIAAASAISLILAVTASISLVMRLHPHAPAYIATPSGLALGRTLMSVGFALGVLLLLACLGLSGWMRSKRCGVTTSLLAFFGALLMSFTMS